MILILSTSKFESTTEDVIRWLTYYQGDWKRINGYDLQNEYAFFNHNEIQIKDKHLSSEEFPVIWYRRWYEKDGFGKSAQEVDNIRNKEEIKQHLYKEFEALSQSIHHRLADNFWLTNPSKMNVNKLIVLDIAQRIGLEIPETFVISHKKDLENTLLKHEMIITKTMTNSPNFYSTDGKREYTLYTEEVKLEDLTQLPATFFPTLFQKGVKKEYEIRVFYLDGLCYSMAIFSQRNTKTQIDFRHYDDETPNRTVPYTLPKDIEVKIQKLMHELGLNTGSIDLIVEKGTKMHYFLEVNPVGQFGMVSIPCNYYLEKKVATLLMYKQRIHERNSIRSKESAYQTAT